MYLANIFERKPVTTAFEEGLVYYDMSNLRSSKPSVYADVDKFPAETDALKKIMGASGLTIIPCTPDSSCRARFIAEAEPSIVAYMRFMGEGKKADNSPMRATLECRWIEGASSHKCAFLYQLMTQAMLNNSNAVFNGVELFTYFHNQKSNEVKKITRNLAVKKMNLPPSICSRWLEQKSGLLVFEGALTTTTNLALFLSSLSFCFYLMITTLTCIANLKSNGFFRQLLRGGLSPASFWAAILTLTIAECALLSGAHVLSMRLTCPGVFTAKVLVSLFAFISVHFLGLAAIVLLLQLLVSSRVTATALTMLMCTAVYVVNKFLPTIKEKFSAGLIFFPITNLNSLVATYATSSIWQKMYGDKNVTQNSPVMLACATGVVVLHCLVLFYVDHLIPSGNGLRLPPYFLFTRRYWQPSRTRAREFRYVDKGIKETGPHIEPASDGLEPSIIVDSVKKTYKCCNCSSGGVKVLNGLSCWVYKNQITALIGHNGAGKSTLIKILTGEECADDGAAYINGFKATDSLERLALIGSITVCPQLDSLCGELTVLENIQVTLNCTGRHSGAELERARAMLQRLGIGYIENLKSLDLSGGQRRLVSTILALLGNPQVVFLDEPTSGLDSASRHQLWQLLQEEKVDRSIVLCTQSMDEADLLADRKIFLIGGQAVCSGSSMFLKRAFGWGFLLNVTLKSKSDAPILLDRLKHVQLRHQFETELQLVVPASKSDALIDAVQVLESSRETVDFGVSEAVSLADVFMKLDGTTTSQSSNLSRFMCREDQNATAMKRMALGQSMFDSERLRPTAFRQLVAMLRVNVMKTIRKRVLIVQRLVVPLTYILLFGLSVFVMKRLEHTLKNDEAQDATLIAAGATSQLSRVKSVRDFTDGTTTNTVCVYDGPQALANCSEICSGLKLSEESGIFLIEKSPSVPMKVFMALNSTVAQLVSQCSGKAKCCFIFYASSWSRASSNRQRNVSFGFFATGLGDKADPVLALRKGFAAISGLFGADDAAKTSGLSHVLSFKAFKFAALEITLFLLLFCTLPVSYIADPIEDIATRVRNQLFSMGMSRLTYWTTTFILHWIQYSLCFLLSILILVSWERYRSANFLFVCLILLSLGAASNQLLIYAIAVAMKTRSVPCHVYIICLLFASVFLYLFFYGSPRIEVIIPVIWAVPPTAPVALAYYYVRYYAYCLDYYNATDERDIPDLFRNSWSNFEMIMAAAAMPVHIAILCAVIWLIENWDTMTTVTGTRIRKNLQPVSDHTTASQMDQGAATEMSRVLQSTRNHRNVLEVRQLFKTYPNGVKAVRGVTFGPMAGEIFGLVGVNGAGKTATMSAIVGEEAQTFGECELRLMDGTWVSGRIMASKGGIGYCPQHNPLFDSITVYEHMKLYAEIRGLPTGQSAEMQIAKLINCLGLQPHSNKRSGQLSGGIKRRLCLAIALLGDPSLIVIDEAATGVDPEGKRFISDAIRGMAHAMRSLLVTTHSMQEVEALCTRIGIMNKGRMIAAGTVQQLRSLYGDAYTIDMMLKPGTEQQMVAQVAKIKSAINGHFEGAEVLFRLSQRLQFSVPKSAVGRISDALKWLKERHASLAIEHCAFYQMSLDQVLVKIVNQSDVSTCNS